MKKTPASMPEPKKISASKNRRASKADTESAAKSAAPEKSKRTPRKPLLDAAVDSVKKMLKSKSAAKKSAQTRDRADEMRRKNFGRQRHVGPRRMTEHHQREHRDGLHKGVEHLGPGIVAL